MTGRRPTMRPLFFAFVVLVTLPALTVAQDVPQTPWGAPDLQGNWDFRTITPLQRPEDLGDQAFLTEEEAAQREQGAVDRAVRPFGGSTISDVRRVPMTFVPWSIQKLL